ncbi:MAG: hypothetical protein K1W24_07765 [Lachnospiraceae bacterium]
MKKIFYGLCQELRTVIFNWNFIFCVIAAFLLYFSCGIYNDINTGRVYSVFECLQKLPEDFLKSNVMFSSYRIVTSSTGGHSQYFAAVITAFPFIARFCEERTSGNIRMVISRTGRRNYYIIKFLTAVISGGFIIFSAWAFFVLAIYIFFPSSSYYGQQQPDEYIIIIKTMAGSFFFGSVSVLPVVFFSSFFKNRYMVTCIPFTLMYLYHMLLDRIAIDSIIIKKLPYGCKLEQILDPVTITLFHYLKYGGHINYNVLYSMVFHGGLMVICYTGFYFILERRWDYGA